MTEGVVTILLGNGKILLISIKFKVQRQFYGFQYPEKYNACVKKK